MIIKCKKCGNRIFGNYCEQCGTRSGAFQRFLISLGNAMHSGEEMPVRAEAVEPITAKVLFTPVSDRHYDSGDYCVIDTETTGLFDSDRIIQLSAAKVRGFVVVDEYNTYVNPQKHIGEEATAVNGITDDMVADAPLFRDIAQAFFDFIGGDDLIAHNAKFDLRMLNGELKIIDAQFLRNHVYDSINLAKKMPGIKSYSLASVCEFFGIGNVKAHDSLSDCRALNECFLRMYRLLPHEEDHDDSEFIPPWRTAITVLSQIVAEYDGDKLEQTLNDWLNVYKGVSSTAFYTRICTKVAMIAEKDYYRDEQIAALKKYIENPYAPDESIYNCTVDDVTGFDGKLVSVTGDFADTSREEVERIVLELGGDIHENVILKTAYLIVGSKGSANWGNGNYGKKIKDAIEKNKGKGSVKIVSEKTFLDFVRRIGTI